MDLTLSLTQNIGSASGINNDGVIFGEVAPTDLESAFYSGAHPLLYGIKEVNNLPITDSKTWFNNTTAYNAPTVVSPFLPTNVANAFAYFYLAVEDTIEGFDFNITTAGAGTFVVQAFYSTETGFVALPDYDLSPSFMKTTGISTIRFVSPEDWSTEFIGETTPPERWLLLRVTSGTITTQPVITGAYAISEDIYEEDVDIDTNTTPWYDPISPVLPQAGDKLFFSTEFKPFGFSLIYTNGVENGSITYQYSSSGTEPYENFIPTSDTSEGCTVENSQAVDYIKLTATDVNASAYSEQGVAGRCIAGYTVDTTPTGSTNRVVFGLSETQSGVASFALGFFNNGSNIVYRILEDGTPTYTSDIIVAAGDQIQIIRFNGAIYFHVNGVAVWEIGILSEGVLYLAITSPDDLTEVNNIFLADWSTSQAIPVDLTWETITDFTPATSSSTKLLPAEYFVYFDPPADFVSLSDSVSPTGEEGYVLALVLFVSGAPVENVQLQNFGGRTIDNPDNNVLDLGYSKTCTVVNFIIQNPENFINPVTFGLVYEDNNGLPGYTEVEIEPSLVPVPINSATIPEALIRKLAVVVVEGDATMDIGTPSSLILAN